MFNGTVDQFEKVLALYGEVFTGEFPAADPNVRGTGWPVEDPGYVAGKWAMAPMGPWLWGRRTESDTAKDILENKTGIARLPDGSQQAIHQAGGILFSQRQHFAHGFDGGLRRTFDFVLMRGFHFFQHFINR